MKFQNYIIAVFFNTCLFAQNNTTLFPKFDVGFTHSIYSTFCFNPKEKNEVNLNKALNNNKRHSNLNELQYGFGIGVFLWMPLNEFVVFKPKLEGNFSNTFLKQSGAVFATSFDLCISQGFAIALKDIDEHGIIYACKDMSCYLTTKQPYLLIGPKINLKKYDSGYLHKGFENELMIGFLIGYGINYEFHGTSFAPEIIYSISSTAQNQINETKKIGHTISLVINFF